MILGGKVAAEFWAMFDGVFARVMAGDKTMIEAMNASDAPVHQIYRETLVQEPVALDLLSLTRKRKMEELEIEMLEVEVEAKKLANAAMASDNLAKIADRYHELCQDTVIDERVRLMLKDSFLNMALAVQRG